MVRRFAKVLEEEIEEAFSIHLIWQILKQLSPSVRVGEERWIYTSTLRVSVFIHHYSALLWGIVVNYSNLCLFNVLLIAR